MIISNSFRKVTRSAIRLMNKNDQLGIPSIPESFENDISNIGEDLLDKDWKYS